jgi:ankyrin repeat protein
MLAMLLDGGADANLQDDDGNTPLHFAISGKLMKAAELLLERGVLEDVENNEGLSAWQLWS